MSSTLMTLNFARQPAQSVALSETADGEPVAQLSPARAGFSVSRRVGGAVVRNRVKRRMREVIRRLLPDIAPGWDLVFVARAPSAQANFDTLAEDVVGLLRRAKLLNEDFHRGLP